MPNNQKSDLKKTNEKTIEAYTEFGGVHKHTARFLLWLPEAKLLKTEKKRYLKYFTLPGNWALDIFFFKDKGIIQYNGRGFPEVRYCDNNAKAYSDAKRLLGNTVGKKGNFERLVLDNQPVFWDGFPYDIYNLDFCGTCLPDNQPPFSETFQAIEKIINEHTSAKGYPFIMFLTMKALDSETKPEAKDQLIQNIETNRLNANFTQQFSTLIPDAKTFASRNFVDFILISIPKFICHLCQNRCKVEIRSRAKYHRRNRTVGGFYITKFIFKFTRRNRSSVSISDDDYIKNVKKIIQLNNVKTIDNSSITLRIRRSNTELIQHVRQMQ